MKKDVADVKSVEVLNVDSIMKLIDNSLKYRHVIEINGVKYLRKESMSPKCFSWEGEPDVLRDIHTIKWNIYREDDIYEYYSCDHGWSGDDNHCRPHNPIPEIELEFRKTIGKDLFYFDDIETPKDK